MKRRGPSTEPCGTPLVTSLQDEELPFITTLCFLPVNQSTIQSATSSIIPRLLTFAISLL